MRATLSREKKYELAFAALTHSFVGETATGVLKFNPKNDLGLDGFYEKKYFAQIADYKDENTNLLNAYKLEENLLNSESVNQLTKTQNGKNFVNDYNEQALVEQAKTGNVFESRINAFRDQVLVMFTLSAQNDLFEAFAKNLTELQNASILDKNFVNEMIANLFPENKLEAEGLNVKANSTTQTAETLEEVNA